jgi:hypothetical protein
MTRGMSSLVAERREVTVRYDVERLAEIVGELKSSVLSSDHDAWRSWTAAGLGEVQAGMRCMCARRAATSAVA